MLEPQTRAALTDVLHPPSGFALSHAVATTFTLDLDTALTIPLSFAARRVAADDDPIGILDAVRRAADRVDIFAQAGEVSIATPPSDLVAFLEPMVHPVALRRGIFHPKVWFLEFERGAERAYRFVCASRNLTADRSWDVVASLEGRVAEPEMRVSAEQVNEPLVQLLRALPGMAVVPVPHARLTRIGELADRWRHVSWDPPAGTRAVGFHVWGVGARPQPDFSGIRGLLVSPFLTDDGLTEIKKGIYHQAYLVSRSRSIDGLARATVDTRLRKTYVLDDAAELVVEGGIRPPRSALVGLHAKTYVFDRLDGAHVFIGSLNATGAALRDNVELMVEVVGPVTGFGVKKTIEGLGEFIQEFEYTGGVVESDDEKRDRDLGSALRRMASLRVHADVLPSDEGYSLRYWTDDAVAVPPDVEVTWHPLTRPGLAIPGLPGRLDSAVVVDDLALVDITPFVVVVVRDARGARSEQRTVLLAELHGDIAERRDAVIVSHLTDRNAFMRFLILLLELGGVSFERGSGGGWRSLAAGASGASGLFEALMRAVGPDRTGLAEVERVVAYLSRQPDGGEVLPPGFQELWSSVWTAQQAVAGDARG